MATGANIGLESPEDLRSVFTLERRLITLTTEEALEAITDEGAFEKLVTAILRASNPAYARFIHTGVNAQGKTVKAPVDGFVPLGSSPKIVHTNYTTTKISELERKWLKPSEGDVPKGIRELNEARASNPSQPAVLVLVTNRSPNMTLANKVGEQCQAADIELDLWERSRLSGFLDDNAEGQWLRQKFLGIKSQRLSAELLLSLSEASFDEYAKRIPKSSHLTTRQDEQTLTARALISGLSVLSAPSGFGKTALALLVMDTWIRQKRPALWIPENVFDQETSLSSAIHRILKELHGSELYGDALSVAVSTPFLVVVDDIARAQEPVRCLEKLLAWKPQQNPAEQGRRDGTIHLLTPSWPEFILGTRQDLAKALAYDIIEMRPLELDEALRIYRSRTGDTTSTDEEARSIVEQLGRDPLLIDLHDRKNQDEKPAEVVRSWITRELTAASQKTGTPAQRFMVALLKLAKDMLARRSMDPSANDVEELYTGDPVQYDTLLAIIRETNVLRWDQSSEVERLAFRHDRIRDALLADALNEIINTEPTNNVIADPHYSEYLGEVIVRRQFDEQTLDMAQTVSPLALFSALKKSGRPRESANPALLSSIRHLLHQQKEKQTLPDSFFWVAGRFLAETDALEVEEIGSLFSKKILWIDEALIRNGRVDVAVDYMGFWELGTRYSRRDRLIRHAAERNPNFIPMIATLLESADLTSEGRVRSLLLAGYCGRPQLSSPVENCIMQAPLQRPDEVESAMWAVTQCCRDNLERCIDIVLNAFSTLSSDRPDNIILSEREHALLDHGGRRIACDLPREAVCIIVDECQKRPNIEEELNLFLYWVDDPLAFCHIVRRYAEMMRHAKKAGRATWPYFLFRNEWRRGSVYQRIMSAESRHALWEIWSNSAEPEEDRQIAFELWSEQTSATDLEILSAVSTTGKIGERVLQTRVSLGDKSAFPEFLAQIALCKPESIPYWWQYARGVMDAELAQGIDLSLQRQHVEAPHDLGSQLPELLMELTPGLAEPILVKHWDALQSIPIFFQAALFINAPITRKLAADAFDQAPDRFMMLEHVTSNFGVRETGRSHRVTLTHFKALEPYLDYCSEQELFFLWWECNSRHWFEWRRNYIDPRVSKIDDDRFRSDVSSREALLDKLCRQRPVWPEWVDRNLLDLGYSLEEAFMIIVKWAEKKGTKRAVEVAAELFFNEAHRSHLPLFDRLVTGKTDCALLRSDDVHFAVKYRTLQ